MSAECLFNLYGEITGLGADNKFSVRSCLSDIPTKAGGPVTQSLTTAAVVLDIVSAISGQLIAVMVKALISDALVDPTGVSTLVSNYCFIPEGQVNLYTFKPTVSCIPVVRGGASTVGRIQYIFSAIS